jgi:hypothetical protein
MRDEPLLLVLDQPTAALDTESEHVLFERCAAASRSDGASGRITILVSTPVQHSANGGPDCGTEWLARPGGRNARGIDGLRGPYSLVRHPGSGIQVTHFASDCEGTMPFGLSQ